MTDFTIPEEAVLAALLAFKPGANNYEWHEMSFMRSANIFSWMDKMALPIRSACWDRASKWMFMSCTEI